MQVEFAKPRVPLPLHLSLTLHASGKMGFHILSCPCMVKKRNRKAMSYDIHVVLAALLWSLHGDVVLKP